MPRSVGLLNRSMKLAVTFGLLVALASSACTCGEPLEVLQASPVGQLSGLPAWLEIQFDKPIIDPDTQDPKPRELDLEITPKVAGEIRFPTPASLTYTFAEGLKPAQQYDVSLDSGLRAARGEATLKSAYRFSFTTRVNGPDETFVVPPENTDGVQEFPSTGRRYLNNMDLGERLLVKLAFPAKVDELRTLVEVRGTPMAGGSAQKLDAVVTYPGIDTVDSFLVTPKPFWPKHTKIEVVVKSGLHVAVAGAGPAVASDEQVVRGETYGPLKVVKGPECQGCRPPSTLTIEFSTPVDCANVLPYVRLAPSSGELVCAGGPSDTSVRLEPVPALMQHTAYALTVRNGVTDRFGQVLNTSSELKFETGDATPRFAHQLMFNVLEKKLSPTHEEKVYKTDKLLVSAARLDFAEAWQVIAAQGLGDQVKWNELPWWLEDSYGYEDNCYWDDELGEEVCGGSRKDPGEVEGELTIPNATETTLAVPTPGSDGWSVVDVPLAPYLNNKGGVVVVKSTPTSNDGKQMGPPVVRLLNVTDLGLSAKYSPTQAVVLVTRLSDGMPVADAKVTAYGVARKTPEAVGELTQTTVTDVDGIAVFSASALTPAGESPDMHQRGLFIVATTDDDQAFMWSAFEAGGRRKYQGDGGMVGAVYTERGVYRPGETAYFRVVARRQTATGFATPAGQSVHLSVKAGAYEWEEGEEIFNTDVVLSEFGTAHGSFVVPKSASINTYRLHAELDGQNLVGRMQVAEFRRAEMKVVVATDKTDYTQGDKLTAKINADYLFGAPAAGLTVRWGLRRTWGYFNSKRFPEARFSDYDYHSWYDDRDAYSEFVDEGTATLDENGSFTLTRPLNAAAARRRIENLVVSATVDDASGQSVSSTSIVQVHPASVHVGLVTHGYLKEKGKIFSFEVAAVNTADELAQGVPVTVSTVQQTWYSVKRKGPGGRMYWDYKHETVNNDNICKGTTNAQGLVSCQFTPQKGGSLRVVVVGKDKKGREVRASSWYWITGDDDYYGGRSDGGNQVGVFAEKPEVDAGGTATIALTSPFKKALALITVEREDILWRKVVEVGTSATVEIPVPSEWAPNVWVSATLVRGRISPENGMAPDPERDKPAYALGYFNLKVKPTANVLAVKVESDKPAYEPGNEVTAKVMVKDGLGKAARAEVNLYAVDEGVLMLTGYRTPDLLSALLREREYAVLAMDTRMHVLGQRKFITPVVKGEEDGGGGGDEQADELRKDFNPVATWVGAVVTDDNGQVTHTFKVPDTLTTYRLMAVAVTNKAQVGKGDAQFKVNKTLMMRQALSRFLRPGDKAQAGVVLNHLLADAQDVTVTLENIDSKLFTLGGDKTRTVRVGPKETVAVRWDITAKDAEGASELIFSARAGKYTDKVQLVLPVKRETPRQTVGVAGVVDAAGKFNHTMQLPEGARALAFNLNMSGLPVAALEERLRNLVEYPYGCLEQRTSRVMPLVAVRKLAEELKFASIPSDKIKGWVEEWVTLVPKYSCPDNGFDYYPGCAHGSDPYLTAFALDGMLTAKKFGYAVPQALIDKAAGYLEGQFSNLNTNGKSWDQQASGASGALRVLAEVGRSKPAWENALYEGRTKLPLFAKTDLLRAVYAREKKATPVVNTLLAEVMQEGKRGEGVMTFAAADANRYSWAWDSAQRSTALVLRSLLEVTPTDARVPLIVKGLVDIDGQTSYWVTQGLTQTLLALAEAVNHLNAKEKPKVDVSFGGKSLLSGKTVGTVVESVNLDAAALGTPASFDIALANTGTGPLFFGGFFQYAYPATTRLPKEANGFDVERTYTDRKGNPIGDRVKVGDYVMVNLTVKVSEAGKMVVVDDPLPAGLEPVDTSLATSDQEMATVMEGQNGSDWGWWRSRYAEIRDDRVEYHFRQLWESNPRYPLKLRYLTRATTAGTYYAPGTHVERMYQPHINGRGAGRALTVVTK